MNGQTLSKIKLRYWLLLASMLLFGITSNAWATTVIQSLIATPSSAQPGQNVVINYVISTTGDHFPENGTATFTLMRDSLPLAHIDDVTILTSGNIQNGVIRGSEPLAFLAGFFQNPGTYQVKMDISGREPGPTAPVPYSDGSTTSFQVLAQATVVVTPTHLTLSGAPGRTVTGTFSITQGQGPFSAAAEFGTLSSASPALGQTVTYSKTVDASATPGSRISDTITLTPASGNAVTIPVTIDVTQAQPLVVQPSHLALSGAPGRTVTGTFSITQGQGPFSAAAEFGTLSNASPALAQTVIYSKIVSAGATPGSRISDTITVTPASGNSVTIPVTIDVTQARSLVVQPTHLALSGDPGQTVTGTFSISQGQGPFLAAAEHGTLSTTSLALGQTVTYSKAVDTGATPGSRLSDTITVTPASGSPVTIPVTIDVTQAQPPITVQPTTLSITGDSGSAWAATFAITSGAAPFNLQSTDGRGRFSNANPGLNETVTYTFNGPSNVTDGQQFSDSIIVTEANGVQATVPVSITARLTNKPIDEAMQAIAQTQPQRATAAVISNICPKRIVGARLQQDCNVLVGGALSTDGTVQGQAGTALAQVTVDQASAPVNASQTSVQAQVRNVGTRIAALRGGARGLSARGLSFNLNGQGLQPGQLADDMLRQLADGTGGAAGSDTILDFGRIGIFVNGSVSLGDKNRTDNVAGFDFQTTGITLGADYRLSDTLVGGIALGYSRNDLNLDASGGGLNTDGYSLSVYGTFYEHAGLYLDGILSYGWNDFDQDRNVRYTISNGAGSALVNQIAHASYNGHQWSASLGGGYSMNQGALAFGPTARLEYVDTTVDGFQEAMSNPALDGGGWATRINDQNSQSFNTQLGGDLSYTMSQSWGVLIPQTHVEWVHEFDDGSQNVTGHFVQDPSRTTFALNTNKADSDYFNLRMGVSAQLAGGRSAFLYYQKLLGYSNLDIDTIATGLRLEF